MSESELEPLVRLFGAHSAEELTKKPVLGKDIDSIVAMCKLKYVYPNNFAAWFRNQVDHILQENPDKLRLVVRGTSLVKSMTPQEAIDLMKISNIWYSRPLLMHGTPKAMFDELLTIALTQLAPEHISAEIFIKIMQAHSAWFFQHRFTLCFLLQRVSNTYAIAAWLSEDDNSLGPDTEFINELVFKACSQRG